MRFAIFDTETTGLLKPSVVPLEKQPKIIEFGLMITDGSATVAEHNWLIDPKEQITDEIKKITGIQQSDIDGQPTFSELLPEIVQALKGVDVLVCHNAPFDVGMLTNELKRCGALEDFKMPDTVICTVQEYKPVFGFRPKLTNLYEHFVGKKLAQTHRAIDDVRALHEALVAAKFFGQFDESQA